MFVLVDIGWAIMATVFFIFFHFVFERGLRLKKVMSLNISFWNIEIISGLYYSIVSLSIQLFIWNFDSSFSTPISLVFSLVIVTLRTPVSAVVNLIPSLVFFMLTFEISILTYVVYVVGFLGMISYQISAFFLKRNWVAKVSMLTTIALSSLIAYFIYLGTNNFLEENVYESTLIVPLMLFISLVGVSYFISFSKSANILFDSVTYTYQKYYRHAVGISAIQNEIKVKKWKNGLFIVFSHSYTKPLMEEDEREIRFAFLSDIEKTVPNETILFYIQEDIHGMFIPFNQVKNIKKSIEGNALESRNNDDFLAGLEEFFTKSQKYYHTANGEIAGVKLKVGVSIYGVQDSSLAKLEQNSMFALTSFNSKSENIISLFESSKMKEVLDDSRKLKDLDQALKLDNFEIKYRGIYSKKDKKFIAAISTIINNSEFNLMQSVREHVKFNNWQEEFDRYFAIVTLRQFADAKIQEVFINYSPATSIQLIDINLLNSKITQLGIWRNGVCFIIDTLPKSANQIQNIKALKEAGYKIAFENLLDQKTISKINPNYLMLSPKNFEAKVNFEKERIVFYDIKTRENLNLAISNGASLFAGELINEESELKNFDIFSKQSKMYLEDLL